MKKIFITLLIIIVSLLAGAYVGAKYIGKASEILLSCTMGKIAIKKSYLPQDKLNNLYKETGAHLAKEYPNFLIENYALSDEMIKNASSASECSQMLVSLSEGIKSIKK